jgi:ribonucleoside-triphosphate reductase
VQNWNDGKRQEYKERKVYNAAAALKREFAPVQESCGCGCAPVVSAEDMLTLVTTSTCGNCRMAKNFLDKAGLTYEVLVADQDEAGARAITAIAGDIRQVPTLVVKHADGTVSKSVNIGEIQRYINNR